MNFYLNKYFLHTTSILLIIISSTNISTNFLGAEELYLEQMQIDSSTKPEGGNLDLPSNPFELVEMIRRANSMTDATKPADAIDEALKAFDNIEGGNKNLTQ